MRVHLATPYRQQKVFFSPCLCSHSEIEIVANQDLSFICQLYVVPTFSYSNTTRLEHVLLDERDSERESNLAIPSVRTELVKLVESGEVVPSPEADNQVSTVLDMLSVVVFWNHAREWHNKVTKLNIIMNSGN